MNKHYHYQVAPNAIATFSKKPGKELLKAIQQLAELAAKKENRKINKHDTTKK